MSSAVQSRKIALPRALAHGAKREKSGVPRAKLDKQEDLTSHHTWWLGRCCCCCSTQRARARAQPPGPQAREPLSLWTEAWPICAADSVQHNAHGPDQKHERRIKCEVRPRCGRSFSCARDGAHDFGNNSLFRQTCRASSSTCQMSTLENVPQLARVVRCVVRVLYTL